MSHVYIITDPIYEKSGRFKFGITGCNHADIIKQYLRFIPQVTVRLFEPCKDAKKAEDRLKELLVSKLVRNVNGSLSEWVDMDYRTLKTLVIRVIKQVDNEESESSVPCTNPCPSKCPIPDIEGLNKLKVAELKELYKSVGAKRPERAKGERLGGSSPPRLKADLINSLNKLRKEREQSMSGRERSDQNETSGRGRSNLKPVYNYPSIPDVMAPVTHTAKLSKSAIPYNEYSTVTSDIDKRFDPTYLDKLTDDQLVVLYQRLGLPSRSNMDRDSLIGSIQKLGNLLAEYGNGNVDYGSYTLPYLKILAKRLGVPYSGLRKEQLIAELKNK